jgi:hypothetical protein
MNPTFIHTKTGLSELKLFFAHSRTLTEYWTWPLPLWPLWFGRDLSYRLYRAKGRMRALALLNSASYYPITLLAVVIITACT